MKVLRITRAVEVEMTSRISCFKRHNNMRTNERVDCEDLVIL